MLSTFTTEQSALTAGNNINTQKAVYTVPEAASYLTICERKLRELIAEGEIRHCRIGRRVLLRIEDLSDYLESQLV